MKRKHFSIIELASSGSQIKDYGSGTITQITKVSGILRYETPNGETTVLCLDEWKGKLNLLIHKRKLKAARLLEDGKDAIPLSATEGFIVWQEANEDGDFHMLCFQDTKAFTFYSLILDTGNVPFGNFIPFFSKCLNLAQSAKSTYPEKNELTALVAN